MKSIILPGIVALLLFSGCTRDHFITDPAYRSKVEAQFEKQKELARHRSKQLFSVLDSDLTTRESDALKFLFAYSPLSDLADYTGEFFLQNVRATFAARDTFHWGKTVPENLFRHFVLPVRVNNENLDSSRWVFFAELKDRIRNLPMKEAVLEVNHWCHEKVTYHGSDMRTSSPLATVRTALGRCGEESTFTVAALRSVGIPARQCYTPRWAHSDDNHAWVEVWVDSAWHYIGACEPDAGLDLAWFTQPAGRAMLVNTTVFGDYEGPEDVLLKDPLFTRINVLENYAPTKKIFVKVTGTDKLIRDSANVEFQLYNYAEFYPLFRTVTGKDGLCSFKTGFGDLLVWASKGAKFGFQKFDVRTTDTLTVVLDHEPGQPAEVDYDMVPPAGIESDDAVSAEDRERNNGRLAFEDGLRKSYEDTFIDSARSIRFARLVKLDGDTLRALLQKSRGNWRELTSFITQVPAGQRSLIIPLLENISEKDLRDIDTAVLSDIINHARKFTPLASNQEDFYRYVLSPRVDNEYLKPFRLLLQSGFDMDFIKRSRENPGHVADWIRANITPDNVSNYSRTPLTPAGVFELRVADNHSGDIFFVATCRSFGIPARLDPAIKVPQYMLHGQWQDVYIFDKRQHEGIKGTVVLLNPPGNEKKPEYTIQFTLEEYRDGFFRTLDYEGSPLVSDFPCTLSIPAGTTLMVTGKRLADGTVLSRLRIFEVKPGESVTEPVVVRKNTLVSQDYGRINTSLFKRDISNGIVVAWIDPGNEPTKHLLAELREKRSQFGHWKGSIALIFPSQEQKSSFVKDRSAGLPENIIYSCEPVFPLKLADIRIRNRELKSLPVVIFVNNQGVIRFLSEGYRIGTGNELLDLMK